MAQQQAAADAMCTHADIRLGIRNSGSGSLSISQNEDDTERADQQSVQCLVNHLRSRAVRELCLRHVRFLDEGFNVFLPYFASDTTAPLTKVYLSRCDFGGPPDRASQLVAAIRTNASVTDLRISYEWLHNATLDSDILAGLLGKNNPPLQKLLLNGFYLRLGNADVLRRALGNIPHLMELSLSWCHIDDANFQVIADGLVGNTTMEVLDISHNLITSNAFLSNIARLLESMRLKALKCGSLGGLTIDTGENAQRFATVLSNNRFMTTLDLRDVTISSSVAVIIFQALGGNTTLENLTLGRIEQGDLQLALALESLPVITGLKRLSLTGANTWNPLIQNTLFVPSLYENTSLEELAGLDLEHYPEYPDSIRQIHLILARNRSMKRVALLVQPLPGTGVMIPAADNLSWRRAIFRLSRDDVLSGATPIFRLLQSHPAILEIITPAPRRRQQQPVAPPPVAEPQQIVAHHENEDNVDSEINNNKRRHDRLGTRLEADLR